MVARCRSARWPRSGNRVVLGIRDVALGDLPRWTRETFSARVVDDVEATAGRYEEVGLRPAVQRQFERAVLVEQHVAEAEGRVDVVLHSDQAPEELLVVDLGVDASRVGGLFCPAPARRRLCALGTLGLGPPDAVLAAGALVAEPDFEPVPRVVAAPSRVDVAVVAEP